MTTALGAIPQPPLRPITGNLHLIESGRTVQSLMQLAQQYGEFFKLRVLKREVHVASSQRLVDELCDESRFEKTLIGSLVQIRALSGDGLFTAYNDEPNWAKAHRLLMPAFGPIAIRGMFDEMVDIADQMLTRWERFGPDAVIDLTDNMTRLTLDTIGLCAFSTRFNSFYQDELHPFVSAMVRALSESSRRNRRPGLMNAMMLASARQYEADRRLMSDVARNLIEQRRHDPQASAKRDLLSIMMDGLDPVTNERLSDENIGFQLVTFLIAGHETTSGLLSFTTYLLLKNPEVLGKARAIVDAVLGAKPIRIEDLARLRYLEQILMEALRLWPTAPAFSVRPRAATTIGGKFALSPDDTVVLLIPTLHRDPAVWGDDAEIFRPERFTPDLAEQLPANAWKPFGNGMRACIGRPFAMQEALIVLAMMLQRFDLVLDDPGYQLAIHETLTIKPEGLRIRAKARSPAGPIGQVATAATTLSPKSVVAGNAASGVDVGRLRRLAVLFGSNTGSSEAFAARIADDASTNGFRATARSLDDAVGTLLAEEPLVVVTASYEGQPPDNARQFVAFVEALGPGSLSGLRYAVFGCGNRQWARTYQAIPKRIDAALERAGATRLMPRAEADSGGDFFGAFDEWYAALWPALGAVFGVGIAAPTEASTLQVEILTEAREDSLRLEGHRQAVVVENRELVDMNHPGARSKRHLELALPEGMIYRSGDYLAVLPRNPAVLVDRALRRFAFARDAKLILHRRTAGAGALPLGRPISAGELLSDYAELNQPTTRAQLAVLAASATCPPDRKLLSSLSGDAYETEILQRRTSVLDLLERHPSIDLPFAAFLEMLPPVRARQYSISSSPLWRQDHATLTVAVVDAPALSGMGRYQGLASTMLASAQPGDRISVSVWPSNTRFHPPTDPAVPIVLICAGSGVAPFRGFLQERAAQKAAGRIVGSALLFFGVDAREVDYLYRDEFARWETLGIVEVFPAFSEQSEGERYVQDRVWAERQRVAEAFSDGATVYVCGDGRYMAPAVRSALIRIYREVTDVGEAEAQRWADEVEHERGRYVSDVFG